MFAWPIKTTDKKKKNTLKKQYTKKKTKVTSQGQTKLHQQKVRDFLMTTEQASSLVSLNELPIMSNKINKPAQSDIINVATNASDQNATKEDQEPAYRFRNHSYRQSINTPILGASNNSTEIIQEEEQGNPSGSIDTTEADKMGSIENLLPPKMLLKREEFDKKTTSNKLEAVFEAINRLHLRHLQTSAKVKDLEFAVFDEESGVLPQMKAIAEHAQGTEDKMKIITAELLELREELDISKGIIQKQSKQIAALKGKQVDLMARSMADNITIASIKGDSSPEEDTSFLVENFLMEEMEIELQEEDRILIAHRMGIYVEGKHRPIVFRCPSQLKKKIFSNTQKLAGKSYSLNQQLPDAMAENKREIRAAIKARQKIEQALDENSKSTFKVKANKLYINGQMQKKKLAQLSPQDLFSGIDERKKMQEIDMKYTRDKPFKTCNFRAAGCNVNTLEDLRLAYKRLHREFPHADHIVAAFCISGELGFQDDGEYGAGFRMQNYIEESKMGDLAVFVIRFYGGQHLGPQRFSVIKELTEEVMEKIT